MKTVFIPFAVKEPLCTALKIGTYTIKVQAAGFQSTERTHLSISIQQEFKLDLSLGVTGDVNTVSVTTGQESLQTQEASVGQTISEREMNNLPLNGRNYTLLTQLAPGTTTTTYDSGHGEL
ncbi:carboxypeptidase-like regulatory domain-containing protein [Tunturiibacter gelidoferens]|uniref:PEGA domain-containing protein n=1 Tax=Tunturiibacter gelidiferens TaxID=3069689 RepID=A0A9X0QH18_9BACT|nr:carboxypeptidase-like regulatory domain-containing protein [Edaphobacter lichenicola]MBB5330301.1 hypothetical protein [Edaphobacter lichenicola]